MLRTADLVAFLATTDAARSKAFFTDVIGLDLIEDMEFACTYDAHGTRLMVTPVESMVAASYTVLGWEVADVAAEVRELAERGVTFLRFDGMGQDELGVWSAPSGAKVVWFKDPDGNTLSLSQHP